MLDVKADFGAVGDGAADDSDAWQQALDHFAYGGSRSGGLKVPQGDYRVTRTLVYAGGPGYGLRIAGEIGGTSGPTGCCLRWDGPDDGDVLRLLGANGSVLENFEIDGAGRARRCLWLDATNHDICHPSPPSSGNILQRLTLLGFRGAEGAGLAFGHPAALTPQVSEVEVLECVILGNGSDSGAGIRTLVGGNVKNFKVRGGTIVYCARGIDFLAASGALLIDGVTFGGQFVADVRAGGSIQIANTESESAVSGARFLENASGANPAAVTLINNSWEGNAPDDDVIISSSAALTLIGNRFFNYRTPTSVPRVVVTDPRMVANAPSGIVSFGNYFQHAQGDAPFFDGSGNPLFDPLAYYGANHIPISALSVGDHGGVGGAIAKLAIHFPAGIS